MARKRISKSTAGRDVGKGMPMRSVDVVPASPLLELRVYAPEAHPDELAARRAERSGSESEPKSSVIVIDLC